MKQILILSFLVLTLGVGTSKSLAATAETSNPNIVCGDSFVTEYFDVMRSRLRAYFVPQVIGIFESSFQEAGITLKDEEVQFDRNYNPITDVKTNYPAPEEYTFHMYPPQVVQAEGRSFTAFGGGYATVRIDKGLTAQPVYNQVGDLVGYGCNANFVMSDMLVSYGNSSTGQGLQDYIKYRADSGHLIDTSYTKMYPVPQAR